MITKLGALLATLVLMRYYHKHQVSKKYTVNRVLRAQLIGAAVKRNEVSTL